MRRRPPGGSPRATPAQLSYLARLLNIAFAKRIEIRGHGLDPGAWVRRGEMTRDEASRAIDDIKRQIDDSGLTNGNG